MKILLIGFLSGAVAIAGLTGCKTMTKAADPIPSYVALFNGQDLNAWQAVSADAAVKKEDVWSVSDGLIDCKGVPVGFIYTQKDYLNFQLVVEYRWTPGKEPSNSGVFSRITDLSKSIPRCVECQLKHGSNGDVLGLQGMMVSTNQPHSFYLNHPLAGEIHGVKKSLDAEAQPGDWNRVEILAKDDTYTVWINGDKVNEVTGVERVPGKIGLQSEGGPIQFRRAALTPLP